MSSRNEDNDNIHEPDEQGTSNSSAQHDAEDGFPEPPARWKPDQALNTNPERHHDAPSSQESISGTLGSTRVELKGDEAHEFQSARRFVTASLIISVLSLFFGGTFASCIALGCALYARSKLNRIVQAHSENPVMQMALSRVSAMAIGVAVVILIINIVAVVFLYPQVMEMIQSGNFGPFGGSQSTSTATGSVTWG